MSTETDAEKAELMALREDIRRAASCAQMDVLKLEIMLAKHGVLVYHVETDTYSSPLADRVTALELSLLAQKGA